ncbi:MAG: hypothetical protein ACXADX_07105 [Candidatus Hodarchaeales archaeon]|jgi:cytochrome c-type biogenesis protein CcmH/NrfF
MIQNYPEIVIADGGLPPLAMRTEVTIQLFVAVIVIETIIIMLAAPRELRLKSLWLVPLVNLLSSCLLGPAQIANEDGSFFHPPIFLPAMAVWRDDFGFYEALLGLLLAFAIFVVLLGCLTVCVEGSLARLALLPSSKHLWKQIGLANAASYLFLYAWSCWLGYSLREKKTGNSSDAFIAQLTDSVGRRVSEKGAESLKTYAWLLFFLAAAVMLLLIGFGMYRTRQMERSEEPQFSFLLAYGSLIGGVWLNLGSIQLFVFLLIAGIYVLLISLPVVFLLLLPAGIYKVLMKVKEKEEVKIHQEQEET